MIKIRAVSWSSEHQEDLIRIRREVFIQEQLVSEDDEWDDHDLKAIHFLAVDTYSDSDKSISVATARLLPSGKITRVAVLKPYRHQGIGTQLIQCATAYAASHFSQKVPYLDAQIDALPFYKKLGFSVQGQPFWDAGILHIRMIKQDTEGPAYVD